MELYNQIIKNKMDLEAASNLLNEVLEREKAELQNHANYNTPVGEMLFEKKKERFSVYVKCKDDIDYVIDFLKDYIKQENIESPSVLFYKPRKASCHEIGKYQTEVLRAKSNIETLYRVSRMTRKGEYATMFQECITKLNYVYSHISKNK